MKNRALESACIITVTCILTSCSGAAQPPVTTTTIMSTPSASTSPTATTSSPPLNDGAVSPPSDTAIPNNPSTTTDSVLTAPTETGKVNLALGDFFRPSTDWIEGRYDVADQQNISGIKSEINKCYSSDPINLELRLANHFQTLSFTVGQANDSYSSDQVLIVRVTGNNKQIEVHPIDFNSHQNFSISVSGVNAFTIEFYLDNSVPTCGGNVDAVLYDITLE